MSVKRYIVCTALMIVLHQLGSGLGSLCLAGNSGYVPRNAWAEEPSPEMQEPLSTEMPTTPAPDPELRTSSTSSAPAETITPTDAVGPKQGLVDILHSGISQGLLGSANWLDSFFADERALKEENQSYFFVQYNAFYESRTDPLFRPEYGLRLALPQLQKRTRLVLSAEPPATTPGDPASTTATGSQVGPTDERNVTAAVHYLYKTTPEESFIIRGGARVHDRSLEFFAGPRYRWLIHLNPWDFRFTQEVVYRTDTKWQTETIFDLERQLPYDLFFRTGINGTWREEIRGYFYRIGCTLRQPLDAAHAVQYEWVNNYQTRPVHELVEIALRIRYRQSFWRPWLFFEVAPQVRFPRDRDFDMTPGVLFKFEMFFGRTVRS